MKRSVLFLVLVALLSGCESKSAPQISGTIDAGLRILVLSNDQPLSLNVYRGDYVLPVLLTDTNFTVSIPGLSVNKSYPVGEGESTYIKMSQAGTYEFTAGPARGKIKVIEYTAPRYTGVSAPEVRQIISNVQPLILDVRTPGEYAQGHIAGARLLPVQIFQQEMNSLEAYKEQPILIYCASGNRSTVAARLLIEAGYQTIYNMRYGIQDWAGRGYEIVTE